MPRFVEQIARGGPVTLTLPKAELYFLTMDETVNRTFRAAAICPADNGIAAPRMGESIPRPHISEVELACGLTELRAAMSDMYLAMLIAILTRLVPEYQPSTYLLQRAAAPIA